MYQYHDSNDPNSEFTELSKNEISHIQKTIPKSLRLESANIPVKTIEFGSNFDPKVSVDELEELISHQYFKFVNAHHKERSVTINHLKQIKNEIECLMEKLQYNDLTNLVWISNMSINESTTLKKKYNKNLESDYIVKEELEFLIKKYGMKEITYVVDVITTSKSIKNNQGLE